MKSAERKTKQQLKEMEVITNIKKMRKTFWFEKFFWFISSENYLVVGGRDQQQNEMIVKKYMRATDVYVHADLRGASSVVIKNPGGGPVPPKTLNEAGAMAVCYSGAWDAKVVAEAYWVRPDQVTKTAPTGEYLTTGAFMIRGKRNFLPQTNLVFGFTFLFRLEDDCVERHRGERNVRASDEDGASAAGDAEEAAELDIDVEYSGDEKACEDGETDSSSSMRASEGGSVKKEAGDESAESTPRQSPVEESADGAGDRSRSDTPHAGLDFPDTALVLQHVKGDVFEIQHQRTVSTASLASGSKPRTESTGSIDNDSVASENPGKPRISAKERRMMKKLAKARNTDVEYHCDPEKEDNESEEVAKLSESVDDLAVDDNAGNAVEKKLPPVALKRGQKSKLKKINKKYKDQDEEERNNKMERLASAGTAKEKPQKNVKGAKPNPKQKYKKNRPQNISARNAAEPVVAVVSEPKQEISIKKPNTEAEAAVIDESQEKDADEAETPVVADDTDMLNYLTGNPFPDDVCLFVVPMCAPYSAVSNYKYKVKLTPGTGRRGKAAKSALQVFLRDKTATNLEKDLLKSVKDVDLSRNIPGKVKVSAPQLHKRKK